MTPNTHTPAYTGALHYMRKAGLLLVLGGFFMAPATADVSHTQVIKPAGGTITISASRGDKVTLTFPANAVASDTTITVKLFQRAPSRRIAKVTFPGIRILPAGLRFGQAVTLRVQLKASPAQIKKSLLFYVDGKGVLLPLATRRQGGQTLVTTLYHTSDYYSAAPTPAEITQISNNISKREHFDMLTGSDPYLTADILVDYQAFIGLVEMSRLWPKGTAAAIERTHQWGLKHVRRFLAKPVPVQPCRLYPKAVMAYGYVLGGVMDLKFGDKLFNVSTGPPAAAWPGLALMEQFQKREEQVEARCPPKQLWPFRFEARVTRLHTMRTVKYQGKIIANIFSRSKTNRSTITGRGNIKLTVFDNLKGNYTFRGELKNNVEQLSMPGATCAEYHITGLPIKAQVFGNIWAKDDTPDRLLQYIFGYTEYRGDTLQPGFGFTNKKILQKKPALPFIRCHATRRGKVETWFEGRGLMLFPRLLPLHKNNQFFGSFEHTRTARNGETWKIKYVISRPR